MLLLKVIFLSVHGDDGGLCKHGLELVDISESFLKVTLEFLLLFDKVRDRCRLYIERLQVYFLFSF
jgi:hypothetical protein